ncbi:MAG: hypothetical protein AAGG46_04995, partial [Planctomycetota bacterium]
MRLKHACHFILAAALPAAAADAETNGRISVPAAGPVEFRARVANNPPEEAPDEAPDKTADKTADDVPVETGSLRTLVGELTSEKYLLREPQADPRPYIEP